MPWKGPIIKVTCKVLTYILLRYNIHPNNLQTARNNIHYIISCIINDDVISYMAKNKLFNFCYYCSYWRGDGSYMVRVAVGRD